jgi:ATP-dependent helicase HrpB
MNEELKQLPVYSYLDRIEKELSASKTMMLHAEPGAGKTTLVPWKLLSGEYARRGKILLLQPRRIAARMAAQRIAEILGERLGDTAGVRTKTETIVSARTKLEVVTEGVLTRILQRDQSLEEYSLVIFDEFHERNLACDLALALTLNCRELLRNDLGILFMSATLPGEDIIKLCGDIPQISVPGRSFPVEVFYRAPKPRERLWEGIVSIIKNIIDSPHGPGHHCRDKAVPCLYNDDRDILVFLPGFREIRKCSELIREKYSDIFEILILHGSLPPSEQQLIFKKYAKRKIILSTNIAETSLTIPGVSVVIDSGLRRRVSFNTGTGMDHWDTAAISQASAEQRMGRAGRTSPGVCWRCWDKSVPLERFTVPEILESDLVPLLLDVYLWGVSSTDDLTWITLPPVSSIKLARATLLELGFIDEENKITEQGRESAGAGVHPRLARMIIEGKRTGYAVTACACAAILEEGDPLKTDDIDFCERLAAFAKWLNGGKGHVNDNDVKKVYYETERLLRIIGVSYKINAADIFPDRAGVLLAYAYPDRVAKRTDVKGIDSRWVMSNGRAARLSGALSKEEYVVIADLDGGEVEGKVFLAAQVSKKDIENGMIGEIAERTEVVWKEWKPSPVTIKKAGSLKLSEKNGGKFAEDFLRNEIRKRIVREGLRILPWSDASLALLARCRYVGKKNMLKMKSFAESDLLRSIDEWIVPFAKLDGSVVFTEEGFMKGLEYYLGWENMRKLDELVPETIKLPSGNSRRVDYESGETPVLAARLQEFFGMSETPQVCNEPLLLHLLSPSGKAVQVTNDINGFWKRAYPEVKKELMGRYPRHYWPENPLEAQATSRAKPRK